MDGAYAYAEVPRNISWTRILIDHPHYNDFLIVDGWCASLFVVKRGLIVSQLTSIPISFQNLAPVNSRMDSADGLR